MSLRIAAVLALSISLMAQAPASYAAAQINANAGGSQADNKGQSSAPVPVTPAGAPGQGESQIRKRSHLTPAVNHPASTATPSAPNTPTPAEASSGFSSITRQPVERWIQIYVGLTAVMALIAMVALGVMRRQLSEMKEARRQTDALIKRAIEQSSATREAGEQTDRLIEQAIEQANHAAEQARAANMAACAAKTSSEHFADVAGSSVQSIQLAQQAMHMEQRAWVFVTETRASELQLGQPLSITVVFKNTGRTPAKNVQISTHLEPLPKGQAPEPKLEKMQNRGVIPPNGTVFVTISTGRKHAEGVTEQGLKAITSGELVIWVYGTITYDDIFETRQATMFCYMLHPDGRTFAAAEVYNDAT
jgi:uncharacterized repeat protein (TIGR01451 family)